MRKRTIGTIIVIYKFPEKKIKILKKSLVNLGIQDKDIYIVDNTEQNKGYAGAINCVLKEIFNFYNYFLILNPDIEIDEHCLKYLMNAYSAVDNAGIIGPLIFDNSLKIWNLGGILNKNRYSAGLKTSKKIKINKRFYSTDFVSGTVMLIKKEVFEKIGFFNSNYFLYYEDVDFCLRASNAGYRNIIATQARVVHFASTSVGKSSSAMVYYMARNHLHFLMEFAPLIIKIRELIRFPKTLYEARNDVYELQGIRDFLLGHFGQNSSILSKADL